jgi:hypothetical protein
MDAHTNVSCLPTGREGTLDARLSQIRVRTAKLPEKGKEGKFETEMSVQKTGEETGKERRLPAGGLSNKSAKSHFSR